MKKPTVLILEHDRIFGKCLVDELAKGGLSGVLVSNADEAVAAADNNKPFAVVCELSLPAHSGTEFLYEFRTYSDWQDVPVIIYSSIRVPEKFLNARDWKLLNIQDVLYKPETSLTTLRETVLSFSAA